MKKAYQKPKIIFESFTLSTCIAAGCEQEPAHDPAACYIVEPFDVLFDSNMGACTVYPTEDGLCYHNPSDRNNLFGS